MNCCRRHFERIRASLVPTKSVTVQSEMWGCLPMEVPLADDTSNGDFADTPDHTPGPEPSEGYQSNQPASIGTDVEHPGMVATTNQIYPYKDGGRLTDGASTQSCRVGRPW